MPQIPHWYWITFLFALGACIGSFLNVVVWRLPRGESLINPPSHCPNCNTKLPWYDNLPIIGWLKLGGKCRFCKAPISPRYPIIETATGVIFALYYYLIFVRQIGPCHTFRFEFLRHYWLYLLLMYMLSVLLAASLIDAELFVILPGMFYWMALVAAGVHAVFDLPYSPGTLANLTAPWIALSIGAGLGLLASVILARVGVMPQSFPKGEPLLEVDREMAEEEIKQARRKGEKPPELPPDYTPGQIRAEISKEMVFLMPPLALGGLLLALALVWPTFASACAVVVRNTHANAFCGALLGAMAGGLTVWLTRILGTLAFGRIGMGLGDADLMFGVGAVLGAGAAVATFFLAPFFGLLIAAWMLLTSKKREMPFGPYLSLSAACVIFIYCPLANYLTPGLTGLMEWIGQMFAK